MPKGLFYAGTAFCLFIALSSATHLAREAEGGAAAFVALHGVTVSAGGIAPWAVLVALIAGLAAAAILIRMSTLLAARDLFAAFVALLSVTAAVTSLGWVLLLQSRMLLLVRSGARESLQPLAEMHFAAYMMLGWFVSLTLLALRPYFRIQASRVLSALVFFPLPLFLLILAQELFVGSSPAPLPAATPATMVYFAVVALLFFSIGIHCIRHRHLFLEMTNLRELLDPRVDPRSPRPLRAAFDS